MFHLTGEFELSPFSRVHLDEHCGEPLTIAFGYEPRKRWRASGHLLEHGMGFRKIELNAPDASVRIIQLPASWCIRARNATCSTPPDTPAPNCLGSSLSSSMRDPHSLTIPVAIMRLQRHPHTKGPPGPSGLTAGRAPKMPAGKRQIHPPSSSRRLRCRRRIVLGQIGMIDRRCEKRGSSLPAPDSALRELMIAA